MNGSVFACNVCCDCDTAWRDFEHNDDRRGCILIHFMATGKVIMLSDKRERTDGDMHMIEIQK